MARDNVAQPWVPGAYFSPTEGNEACYWMPQTNYAKDVAAATDAAINKARISSLLGVRQAGKLAAVKRAFKRGGA